MPPSPLQPERASAEAALAEYLDRADHGEKLDRQQFVAAHPEAARDLCEYFDDLDTVRRALASLADTGHVPVREVAAVGGEFPRGFGSYVLLEKLGSGGMGEVYKAEHRHMERVVAVKTLHARLMDSPEAIERFHREVKAAAQLAHPNVVAAYDAGEVRGVHFLAMEYVDGGNLHALVSRFGTLAVGHAVAYVIQAARGLEFAHRLRVIHRDVKPANLLLDRRGVIKLLDLGLARWEASASDADASRPESLTQLGQIVGTIDYMSPEQAANTKQAGEPADIYGLGCTLFFLLTGRTVYSGGTIMERILAHREAPVPSLREWRSDVPESLDAVFQRMVAKQPGDRPASMSEVIELLEGCIPALERESPPWPAASSGAGLNDTVSGFPQAPVGRPATTTQLASRLLQPPSRSKRVILAGVLVAAALAAAMWAVVIQLETRDGTLVVNISEPGSEIKVLDQQGIVEIARRGAKGTVRISVDPGKYRLKVEKEGFQVYTKDVTIQSGGSTELTARLDPLRPMTAFAAQPEGGPPLAVAPFTAEKARQHQQRWARSLGVPVEHENAVGLRMVLIPPGEFMMGSTEQEIVHLWTMAKQGQTLADEAQKIESERRPHQLLMRNLPEGDWLAQRIQSEGPQHRVRITTPFCLAAHEVTVGQFRRFVDETGYRTNAERDGKGGWGYDPSSDTLRQDPQYTWRNPGFPQTDSHPVVNVSWNDAVAFCGWLSRREEQEYRLPTEAEWEYACRGGTRSRFWCGDDPEALSLAGNVTDGTAKEKFAHWTGISAKDGHVFAAPVGTYRPNPFGLYEVHGNVWEWCADWYEAEYYAGSPPGDPAGPTLGESRVTRGGSWLNWPYLARSASRLSYGPGDRLYFFTLGFRVATRAVLHQEAEWSDRKDQQLERAP